MRTSSSADEGATRGAPATEPPQRLPVEHLRDVLAEAAHLLPAQGPITVFIHHNTLHAFEDLPFADAVRKGAELFGCQPFLPEDRYRDKLRRGRIRFGDLQEVLFQDLGARAEQRILHLCSRLELRFAMLQFPLHSAPTEELRWFVAETDALRRIRQDVSAAARDRLIAETRRWVMRDLRGSQETGPGSPPEAGSITTLLARFGDARIEDWSEAAWEKFTLHALWRTCCDGMAREPSSAPTPTLPIRHRDLLLEASNEDSDLLVHDVLIRFCAAFLDQGLARWTLPQREEGFYQAFLALYGSDRHLPDRWLRELSRELRRLDAQPVSATESILQSLHALGVDEAEWPAYIGATLLALPGWAGMLHQVEVRGDAVRQPIPAETLIDYLAVRLLLERFALAQVARESLDHRGTLADLRGVCRQRIPKPTPPSVEQRAFQVFQLAQVLGWTPATLHHLDTHEWATLLQEIEAFSEHERRRLFHLAYEHRFVTQSLDAVALHRWTGRKTNERPRFQISFCLDDREESIRRHLEEVAPDVETFGIAGFYGVAMYYRGAADAHYVPLCPIVIKPKHWVTEAVVDDLADSHARRARLRRALGQLTHRLHVGSRTFLIGALLTAGAGILASIPLVARILFPRLAARVRRRFGRLVEAPPTTRLKLERTDPSPGPSAGHAGFSLDEMAEIAERQLRDIGLTANVSRLVFLLGHGSLSLNNPHKSAYDCGACGGTSGAPSGRALAQMLNDPRVRKRLESRGLVLPGDTWFVGGFHNSCNDTITFFDVERIPATHAAELQEARKNLDEALMRNAHERCRKFMSAPLALSFAEAREHVEERSEDLAQTRPELGHATNALCVVGRRERTRGLFFDRRAFLTSYDPTHDLDGAILTRLLLAAVPVCTGINLEYYFSRVDNDGFGCGTKLPHNVAALLGVMDGAASDLRTGLPWQMVEIHEPVRLLFILETTPEIMTGIMDRNAMIGRTFRNGWAHLALQDPHTGAIRVYRDGEYREYQAEAERLPHAASSVDWYRGWRDHLEFAEITG